MLRLSRMCLVKYSAVGVNTKLLRMLHIIIRRRDVQNGYDLSNNTSWETQSFQSLFQPNQSYPHTSSPSECTKRPSCSTDQHMIHLSIDQLIDLAILSSHFRLFLCQYYAQENLDFITSVKQWKLNQANQPVAQPSVHKKNGNDRLRLPTTVDRIFARFVRDEVNLSQTVVSRLEARYNSEQRSPHAHEGNSLDLFDEAVSEIKVMLTQQYLRPFCERYSWLISYLQHSEMEGVS